jgi:hypothetical protein
MITKVDFMQSHFINQIKISEGLVAIIVMVDFQKAIIVVVSAKIKTLQNYFTIVVNDLLDYFVVVNLS